MFESPKLAARRRELLARCGEERRTAAIHSQELTHSVSGVESKVDKAMSLVARVKDHPGIIVGAVALLAGLIVVRPRRLAPLVSTGLVAVRALRTVNSVLPMLQNFRARQMQARVYH
ncbi:MAG: hypothetical protein K0S28_213 [Paucimonas sp.]|jgi:hypothetical protein|nr:hypothetical protein [Paucimonas sp.]